MDRCPFCGEPLPEKAGTCPACGRELPAASPAYTEAEFIIEEPPEEPAEAPARKAPEPAPSISHEQPKREPSPKRDMSGWTMGPAADEPAKGSADTPAPAKKPSGVKKVLGICFLVLIALGIIGKVLQPVLLPESVSSGPAAAQTGRLPSVSSAPDKPSSGNRLPSVSSAPKGTTTQKTGSGAQAGSDSRRIVSIALGEGFLLGLRKDGTVAVTVDEAYASVFKGPEQWTDIVEIDTDAFGEYALGLKKDGTVVAVTSPKDYVKIDNNALQKVVGQWRNIVSIEAGYCTAYGVRADGTVAAYCFNLKDQEEERPGYIDQIRQLKGVVQIKDMLGTAYTREKDGTWTCTDSGSIGRMGDYKKAADLVGSSSVPDVILHGDGTTETVYITRPDGSKFSLSDLSYKLPAWKNVKKIYMENYQAIALMNDGTVASAYTPGADLANTQGECNVSGWRDIVDIACRIGCTVGLKKDGTVVIAGFDYWYDNELR